MKQLAMSDLSYLRDIREEVEQWSMEMKKNPGLFDIAAKTIQRRFNKIIPDKIHQVISQAIKHMTRMVISGAGLVTAVRKDKETMVALEQKIQKRIRYYGSTAAVEGGLTGYGGFLWGVADLPLWLSLKIKLLFEIASLYGLDLKDSKERIYILYIFQLAFSSQQHRNRIFKLIEHWDINQNELEPNLNQQEWRTYWEEYRDHIDLVKLLQLIPGLGAAVGSMVNYRLTRRLGRFAMNAYRMRMLNQLHPDLD